MKALVSLFLPIPAFSGDLNRLSPQEEMCGWKLLFNGRNLSDFRVVGSDARPGAGWKIVDGILTKIPEEKEADIIRKREYGDFALIWGWRIFKKGKRGGQISRG